MPTNSAIWLDKKQGKLQLKDAPYTHPEANQIVIRNHAVAINSVDRIIQAAGKVIFSWLKYPFVLGEDVAGEVVEVGAGVTRIKIGDRVIGHAVGSDKDCNSSAEGAFQLYTVLRSNMAAPIPNTLSYERAAVLPLALSTAACGLFQKDHLALAYPSPNASSTGKTLLIWGGSTSVGSNAIQLAVAAGYEVIATASPKNFDYIKKLGASQAFDYNSSSVVPDIIQAFQGKNLAGALAIGTGSAQPCLDIVGSCTGRKFVSMASSPVSVETGMTFRLLLKLLSANAALKIKAARRGIKTKAIFGSTLKDNEVSKIIYEDFLPEALAGDRYVAAPEPYVVGKGLEHIQAGFDLQKKGVSAKKVVVVL